MSWQKIWKLAGADYLKLVPILGLAFYIAFIPHRGYLYPRHVDEWFHLAYAEAMLQSGSTTFVDPFFGEATVGLGNNLEASFHLFLGVFQRLSGIPWNDIFRYLPGLIFIITVLAVYTLAKREGFGVEAAFFTCLIPTTVGILGPAFLVPLSLGLLFTPLVLFLAFNFRSIWSYVLIFVFISFLLAIHAPSAISPIIVLAPYVILNLRGNFRHSLWIILALVVPFLAIFPWIFDLLLPTAKSLLAARALTTFVQLPWVLETHGYLPSALALLGSLLLAMRGGNKNYSLVLGLLALLLMLVTFFTFHYGVPIMYERGLMYMMLMVGIIAGAGLAGVKNLRLPAKVTAWMRVPFITDNIGRVLCLALVGITLVISIPERLDTPYYYMIDSEDYQAFVWIKDNVDEAYDTAILDPWKATAFTAITGRKIYSRIHNYPTGKDLRVYGFLSRNSSDTSFLIKNGITVIYTRVYDARQRENIEYDSDNPDLVEVANNIYLLKETAGP